MSLIEPIAAFLNAGSTGIVVSLIMSMLSYVSAKSTKATDDALRDYLESVRRGEHQDLLESLRTLRELVEAGDETAVHLWAALQDLLRVVKDQSGPLTEIRSHVERIPTMDEKLDLLIEAMGRNAIKLVCERSNEEKTPPVFTFPEGCLPNDFLLHHGKLFVGDWGRGRIAVVDPAEKRVESSIDMDSYEAVDSHGKIIRQYVPGKMAIANGKLFLGQLLSEFVLVVDLVSGSIVKRISVPAGGEGAITASSDERHVHFASNRGNAILRINTRTYAVESIAFPDGGRGSMCVLAHPSRELLYVGIQRGGKLNGMSYPGGNCFLATMDLNRGLWTGLLYLAEISEGRSDDAIPACLVFDDEERCLFVGMFQSRRGIIKVNEEGTEVLGNKRLARNEHNRCFDWVDPIALAVRGNELLAVNRNNLELAIIHKKSLAVRETRYLGEAPNGPSGIAVYGNQAVINYPGRRGLIFQDI